jgi:hypothetical protein
MTAPIRVTVDGEPVTREVTLEQVREYLRARGWEKRAETDKDDDGNLLGAIVEIWGTGAEEILFWTSGPGGSMMQRRISNVIARVAVHEQRHPAAVLREIASGGSIAEQDIRQIATHVLTEPAERHPDCIGCGQGISTREDCEPTPFCDTCAQTNLVELAIYILSR